MSLPRIENPSFRTLLGALSRSRFFTISVALHLLIVIWLGGAVIYKVVQEPEDFEGEAGGGFVLPAQSVQQPVQNPQANLQQQTTVVSPIQMNTNTSSLKALTTTSLAATNFALPTIAPQIAPSVSKLSGMPSPPSVVGTNVMPREVAAQIRNFTEGWGKGSSGTGTGGGVRQRQFQFTAYLAKYGGGNWNSTVKTDSSGKIITGSLPNLLYVIQKWSSDRIKATPDPIPLDLASDQIFSIKPPFIFFTGHRDFVLSQKEVDNLQKYIRLGGALWGDSSVPGRRSRFDIAFRREMRRVVADVDKDFEQLPPDHAIYQQGKIYFPEIKNPPAGLNYYQEPVYALKIYGEIAVLYTANDYGDMWQLGLNEKGKYDLRQNEKKEFIAMNMQMYYDRENYYRNLSEEALVNSYKFGINLIVHLLTRWEDKVRTAPKL